MVQTPLPPPQTSSWLKGSIKFQIFKSQSKSIPIEIHSFSKSILRLDIIDSKSSLFYNENMTPPIANNVLSALPSVTLVTFLISMVEVYQQAEKLKSRKMKEGWMRNDEGWMKNDKVWMKNDERWMMKDDDFKLLKGFALWQTNGRMNGRTDICDCRVTFAYEKWSNSIQTNKLWFSILKHQ